MTDYEKELLKMEIYAELVEEMSNLADEERVTSSTDTQTLHSLLVFALAKCQRNANMRMNENQEQI